MLMPMPAMLVVSTATVGLLLPPPGEAVGAVVVARLGLGRAKPRPPSPSPRDSKRADVVEAGEMRRFLGVEVEVGVEVEGLVTVGGAGGGGRGGWL